LTAIKGCLWIDHVISESRVNNNPTRKARALEEKVK